MQTLSGKIINHDNSFNGNIVFDKKIISLEKTQKETSNKIIIPGFIDLHCHGGNGHDTMQGLNSIIKMSQYHLSNGTTTLMPTTITSYQTELLNSLDGFDDYLNNNKFLTNISGIHLEGPFINSKKLGAQPSKTISPSIEFIKKIQKIVKIKIMTLAPELYGSEKVIDYLFKNKIKVQFGHSIADYACCYKHMKSRKVGFTHLFNAMSGADSRKPGLVTAALKHANFSEIICDLIHVDEANIKLANKCIENLYSISDSICATGLDDGFYKFAGHNIEKKQGKALIDNKILAGSVINMHDSFKNLLKINFSFEEAVAMTSYNASKYIEEKNIGKIDIGYFSNILVLDNNLDIKEIYLYGNLV